MTRKRKREVAGYESIVKETFAAEQTAPCTEALAVEVAGTDRIATGCGSPEGPRTRMQHTDRPRKPKRGPPPGEEHNDTLAAAPAGPVNPILDLGEKLTIAKAGEIKERLAAFLRVPAAFLIVDGSRVAAVDTAGLQLLTVFCHEVHERGMEVLWRELCSSLAKKVEAAIMAIQFYDAMTQKLTHISESLQALADVMADPGRVDRPSAWHALKQRTRARFTVESERRVFDALMRWMTMEEAVRAAKPEGAEPPPAGAIDLFLAADQDECTGGSG